MPDKPRVFPGSKDNLATLIAAAKHGDLAVLACSVRETGKHVDVVVAMNHHGDETELVPLAMFFDEDPYELLEPPV